MKYLNVQVLKRAFRALFSLTRHHQTYSYHSIYPHATFSPWLDDRRFLAIYEGIKNYTLVDIYRCYELWSLAQQVKHYRG